MRKTGAFALAVASLALTACATLFAGGNEMVEIESYPPGASVTTQDGTVLGMTPLVASIEPRDYVLRFALPGHAEATYPLRKKVDGIAYLNLVCILCWGIDFATGAVYGLENDFVSVALTPVATGSRPTLLPLACANYSALEHAVATGAIGPVQRDRGEALVMGATGVSRLSCSAADSAS